MGGEAWPNALLPQHTKVLSVRTPHVCTLPALIEMNLPARGEDSAEKSLPQHDNVRSVRTAQVCKSPALT